MTNRTRESNSFEYVVIAALRAQQLMRGCVPRMPGVFKATTMARLELSAGKVAKLSDAPVVSRTVA